MARLADGRELLGTPARAAGRRARPVGGRGRGARRGRRARPGDPIGRRSAGELAAPADGWLRKPRAGGGGRGVRRWAGGRLRADRDPAAPRARAVVLGGGDRRRPARPSCSASPSSCIAAGLPVDGQRDAAAAARGRAGRAGRPAARGLRPRWRRASACAERSASTRSGTGATPGCWRSTRARRRRWSCSDRAASRRTCAGRAGSACPPPARRRRRGVQG